MLPAEPQAWLALSLRLACAGIAVQSMEVLRQSAELRNGGLLAWPEAPAGGGPRRSAQRLYDFPACAWLLGLRVALAFAGFVVPLGSWGAFSLLGALVLLQLYYNRRFVMLAGNCETIFLIELFAAWSGTLPGATPFLSSVALWFVATHAALAYLVAGMHKLGSRPWRDGTRLQQIVRDGSYRLPQFAANLVGGRIAAGVVSWLVIGLELALPWAVFLPAGAFWPLLAAGFVFHTLVAVLMGLHGFWWAFAAAYPALAYVHQVLR